MNFSVGVALIFGVIADKILEFLLLFLQIVFAIGKTESGVLLTDFQCVLPGVIELLDNGLD